MNRQGEGEPTPTIKNAPQLPGTQAKGEKVLQKKYFILQIKKNYMPVEAEEGPKGGVSLSEIEYLLIFLSWS